MKTIKKILLAGSLISMVMLSGCSVLMNMNPSEKSMKDNFFTYIGQNPFHPQPTDAIVLGKLSFSGYGSIFSVVKLDENNKVVSSPIILKLSYCVTKSRGILPKKKKVYNVETDDIYAGNAPADRRDAFKPILSTGSLLKAVYGGSLGSFEKNIQAMQTQLPKGWFLIRLPEGKYQIMDAEQENNSVSGGYKSTIVTTTTQKLSDGPVFEVKKGVINYIGKYDYSPGKIFSSDLDEAKNIIKQGTGRISVKDTPWEIISAY
jgi:hypothetical protein